MESEMPDPYQCPRCGRSLNYCICSVPRDPATRSLLAVYTELRSAGIDLEVLIADAGLEDDEIKRLDKAATVMKVAFKMVKRVLRARGAVGSLKPSPTGRSTASATAGSDEHETGGDHHE